MGGHKSFGSRYVEALPSVPIRPDMVKGMIVSWSGSIDTIPEGYVLCDGNNDTPDLRDRFVVGAGGSFFPDEVGGSESHEHDLICAPHNHTLVGGTGVGAGTIRSPTTNSVVVTGVTNDAGNFPPFYALGFIMKT